MTRFDWRPVPHGKSVKDIAKAADSAGHLTNFCGGVLYVHNGKAWLQFMLLGDRVVYRRVPGWDSQATPAPKNAPAFTCDVCGRTKTMDHLTSVVYIGGYGYNVCCDCFDDDFGGKLAKLGDHVVVA